LNRINELKSKIKNIQTTYKELEKIAIRFGKAPASKNALKTKPGTWSLIKRGCFARIFPQGYSRTRMQIYIPKKIIPHFNRDNLGRINEFGIKDEINIKITFDDKSKNSKITLHDKKEIPIWRFEKIEFSLPSSSEPIKTFEIKNTGWVAKNLKTLACLDPQKYPEIKDKIKNASNLYSDTQMLKKLISKKSKNSLDDITDLERYHEGANTALTADPKKKMEWLLDHFKKIRDAYESVGDILGDMINGMSGGKTDSGTINFGYGDMAGISDNPEEQGLGFGGLFDDLE